MSIDTSREELMGRGPVLRTMLKLGIPTFIAQFINLLYNVVDRIYIGHISGAGTAALTGVGLCLPVITLVSACSFFACAGGAPRAAIALGRGDRDRAEKILGNSTSMLIAFTVVIMALFYVIKEPFLRAFGASDATYPYADAYLSIYLLGTFFVLVSVGLNTFITAQGKSETAMLSVIIGAVCNIVLDPVFIFLFHMGIRGAAVATVLSQGVSCVWILRFLTSKKASLRLKRRNLRPDPGVIASIASLGISSFIMSGTESLITVVFNKSMQVYGSDLYVASITVLQSVLQIIFVPLNGFSEGVKPIISYNYGAGNMKRVKEICLKLIVIAFCVEFGLSLFCILLPRVPVGLFTSDGALIALCRKALPVYLLGMLLFGLQCGCQSSFVALGQAKQALFFALFRKVILLVPLAIVLPLLTGNVFSVYAAEPVSDAASALACAAVFAVTLKKLLKKADA